MSGMQTLREHMLAFYGKYTTAVRIIFKFLLAFAAFYWIRSVIGYQAIPSNIFVLLVLALFCSILTVKVTPVICGCLLTAQAFGLGYEAGAITVVIFLLLLILFLRFVPNDSLILILLPMAMALGAPEAVPVCFGLKRKPSSILSVSSAVLIYYLIDTLHNAPAAFKSLTDAGMTERLGVLTNGIFTNKDMVLNLLTLSAVLLLVYAVRKLSFNHSWFVAVILGALLYPLMEILGYFVLGTSFLPIPVFIGTAVSIAVALALMLFIFDVNYAGSESLQFEDDDYYYYVKAIPKVAVKKSSVSERVSMPKSEAGSEEVPSIREKPTVVNDREIKEKLEDSLKNL